MFAKIHWEVCAFLLRKIDITFWFGDRIGLPILTYLFNATDKPCPRG